MEYTRESGTGGDSFDNLLLKRRGRLCVNGFIIWARYRLGFLPSLKLDPEYGSTPVR